jgi:hypothetical protein
MARAGFTAFTVSRSIVGNMHRARADLNRLLRKVVHRDF